MSDEATTAEAIPEPLPRTGAAFDDPRILDRISDIPAEPETPEPEAAAAPDSAPETDAKPEPEAATPEPEPEPEPEAAKAKTKDDEETVEIGTVTELAEHLGVKAEDLYNLKFKMPGSGDEVTLGQIKDSYRASNDVTHEAAEVRKQRETLETELAQKRDATQQTLAEAAALVDTAEKRMMSEYESVDWNALRTENPTQWVALRQEVQERQRLLEATKSDIRTRWQQNIEDAQRESVARLNERVEQETAKLLEVLPEWKDPEVAKTERSALHSYLVAQGFAVEEVEQVVDHRAVLLARKARLYDEAVAQAKETAAKKKVVRIGKKTLRAGTAPSKQDTADDKLAGLRKALRTDGSIDAAAALIDAL
jgi:hypothetical protein